MSKETQSSFGTYEDFYENGSYANSMVSSFKQNAERYEWWIELKNARLRDWQDQVTIKLGNDPECNQYELRCPSCLQEVNQMIQTEDILSCKCLITGYDETKEPMTELANIICSSCNKKMRMITETRELQPCGCKKSYTMAMFQLSAILCLQQALTSWRILADGQAKRMIHEMATYTGKGYLFCIRNAHVAPCSLTRREHHLRVPTGPLQEAYNTLSTMSQKTGQSSTDLTGGEKESKNGDPQKKQLTTTIPMSQPNGKELSWHESVHHALSQIDEESTGSGLSTEESESQLSLDTSSGSVSLGDLSSSEENEEMPSMLSQPELKRQKRH